MTTDNLIEIADHQQEIEPISGADPIGQAHGAPVAVDRGQAATGTGAADPGRDSHAKNTDASGRPARTAIE